MIVNIIYPKDGWYLQYTAEQLIKRLDANEQNRAPTKKIKHLFSRKEPFITTTKCELLHNQRKTINYYVNYVLFKNKTSDIDVGHFTHIEPNGLFDQIAKQVDYSICMSEKYVTHLKENGINNCCCITPGIDPFFKPKLVLGWFGRFSSYGYRKGKDLFKKVQQLDFVDLKQYSNLPRKELPKAYNKCDYILVTSRYEGGPMCILEGIACGKKIICPLDVGFANEFKKAIVPYQNSNWTSLLYTLTHLYKEKQTIASLVEKFTWDEYARKHIELFKKL